LLPFAVSITLLNLLGHAWLGFEQAWAHPFVALLAAYCAEIVSEVAIRGWSKARFKGGMRNLLVFLLPAHITGLAVAMLLYANERFLVVAFAAAFAIFSKVLFRVRTLNPTVPTTHFLNPSNTGIVVTLILFQDWVGIAQPYQFTENVSGALDWILPFIICCTGATLNWRATKRLPLLLAWLAGFAMQALVRAAASEGSVGSLLAPMTGFAFLLFTFYMITDPMTTPHGVKSQIWFGAGTACVYGLLSYAGIVFGLFFSLAIVCCVRGIVMAYRFRTFRSRPVPLAETVSGSARDRVPS
jgi:Na+-translocating ferredoxin:NAD+ oxidoreductase RnfD subunit